MTESDAPVVTPFDEAWSDQPYGDGFTHEALHTTWLLSEAFENHVLNSRCAEEFPDVKALAGEIADKLMNLYQIIGSKWA